MKNLKDIFLSEAIACASGYSKELDLKLEDVKTFQDLLRAEKSLAKKISFEQSRDIMLTEKQELFDPEEYYNPTSDTRRNKLIQHYMSENMDSVLIFLISTLIYALKSVILTAGVSGVAALAYGIYKAWDRFMSSAAKACNKSSGLDKSICMIQFKIKGAESVIAQLSDSLSTCNNTDNPGLCKYNMERQLRVWMLKLTQYKKELVMLQNKSKKPSTTKNKKEESPEFEPSIPTSSSKF